MIRLFTNKIKRVSIAANDIFIDNQHGNIGSACEVNFVLKLEKSTPELRVFENDTLIKLFKLEPLNNNPNLENQFLHSSIRVLSNSAVMIDGSISKSDKVFSKWTDNDYEAVRLQPFYLSNRNDLNLKLIGKGLFERGLHFSGTVTPPGVRNICICDNCSRSFTIQHFHAGFSEIQYFYSSNGKETLIVPYSAIEGIPVQLQKKIDITALEKIETELPVPFTGGSFKYYNSLKCPHCLASYIDFEANKEDRPNEYYGNTYINKEPRLWSTAI